MTTPFFLHGLESSGKGTKGAFLKKHFPHIQCPDFSGPLNERLNRLEKLCDDATDLLLIGSSYGGLMATRFALDHPSRVESLVLLAPALNYEGYVPPKQMIDVPTRLILGIDDDVCPPDRVLPLARKTFSHLTITVADDDHMLHNTFRDLDWEKIFTHQP